MKKIGLLFIAFFCFASIVSQAQSYANIVVMDNTSPYVKQAYFNSGSGSALQQDKIKQYWDDDYYISSAAYGSMGWFITMSTGVKWTNQSYIYQESWPNDWILNKRKDGKYITSLAASDDKWLVVVSSNSDYTAQEICSAPWSNLKEFISRWWGNDYYITSIACQNDLWTVVMSKTNLYVDQAYFWATSTTSLEEKIDEYWDRGFDITLLEYGDGEYFCIMSKYKDGKSRLQRWDIGTSDYKQKIKEYWDKSWRITYIGG